MILIPCNMRRVRAHWVLWPRPTCRCMSHKTATRWTWRLKKDWGCLSIFEPIFHDYFLDSRKYLSGSVGEGSVFVPSDVLFCPLLCVRVRTNFYQLRLLQPFEHCLCVGQVEEVNLNNGVYYLTVMMSNYKVSGHLLVLEVLECQSNVFI